MGIGNRIKDVAKGKGMTLKEIAEKAGVSYNTLYSITKRDSERIQGSILQRISDVLEVSPSDLIGSGGSHIDEVIGLIIDEYPKAFLSPSENPNSVRVSLGTLVSLQEKLLHLFNGLNTEGRQKAIELVEILTEVPRYRRSDAPAVAPQPPAEGTDTTEAEKPPTDAPAPADGEG